MSVHPRDDLAAFALMALDVDEARIVTTHVERCESCAAEVASYQRALFAYADAGAAAAPDLRSRIVAREQPRQRAWIAWLGRPLPAFVPAALAFLLIVSVAGLAQARRDADAYASALSAIPGGRVVSLSASDSPGHRGSLVIPVDAARSPYLLLDVPAPPAGRAWEAWVLRGETALPAGISVSGGLVTLTLTAPFQVGDGVAVTLEPAGGSSRPTSPPVLAVPRT